MNSERKHIIKLLDKKTRLDGRGLTDFRKNITIEYNVSKSAEGSARVKIGNTEVIAGIKMEVGQPYPDSPGAGSLIVGVELLPIASPNFESGPPSIEAIELSRLVDRAVRESQAIDLKNLCIREGELIWIVCIDICTLNADGNLFDACALATIAALQVAKFPKLEGDVVDYKNLTDKSIPIQKIPISVTVHKIGDHLIVDPLDDEENVTDARLTVACLDNGELCALQKGGDSPLSTTEIKNMIKLALEKSKELRKLLR